MNRITISLPDSLASLLNREAHRRTTSVSAVVRAALVTELESRTNESKKLPFVGLGRSGHRHTARDADKLLARGWGARDRYR